MDNDLVSVVVPVYNVQDYVFKCLESLAKQSYKNLEIIVVDDGSTDDSGKICDEFAKSDERVKVYHKKNGGLSDARNYGIKKSKGQFVGLVDSDDFVDENFIQEMIVAMKDNDADIVVCGFNKEIPKPMVVSGKEATKKLLIEQENIDIVAWNKLYKKSLFLDNGIWYPLGMKHEDALTTYKLLAAAQRVVYIDKSLYHYVERKNSIMAEVKTVDRLKIREMAAEEAVGYFDDDELKEVAEVSLLLSKYAFMDAAIRDEIEKKYFNMNREWVLKNRKKFSRNKYLTKKLKLYNFLLVAGLYKVFRKLV